MADRKASSGEGLVDPGIAATISASEPFLGDTLAKTSVPTSAVNAFASTMAGTSALASAADAFASTVAGTTARGGAERARGSADLSKGDLVGRYIVVARLGQGGMGVVYAAYDPELDRKVALKLLLARGDESPAARTRLMREAQAMAQLSHPHVVTVYDVGTLGDQVWIAMEFVDGVTLSSWLGSGARGVREILDVFMRAGEGLRAAHDSGLVHRDFKPDNVMIGKDGRVRVMDFGLARLGLDDDPEDGRRPPADVRPGRERAQVSPLTQTGAVMGTPAYMPLEQFEAAEVDARSDQFSFCVALYEALHGERPFAGETLAELIVALEGEQVRPPSRGASVPGWLRNVVVRGLARERARRWPSMQALLAALADDPAVRRRRWLTAASGVALLGLGVYGGIAAVQADARTCAGMDDRLAGVWDPERRAAVAQAFVDTRLSYAQDTWERVELHLDEYTTGWVAARTEACEATHRGEQSAALLDLRMACLDERLQHVRAIVDELARADETVVKAAVQAVLDLPRLQRCADADALTAEVRPPEDPEEARRVEALDRQLIEAEAKERAGKYAEGLAVAAAVVAEAQTLDYEPLRARAWLRQGSLHDKNGDYKAAEALLRQAVDAAVARRMTAAAARASATLVAVVGHELARPDDGRRWAEFADALSRAAGTDEARAEYFRGLGRVADREGKHEEARGHHERALALLERALGPDHLDVAAAHNGLGHATASAGDYEEARRHFHRALAIRETSLGPDHPDVALTLANLGAVAYRQGKYEDARGYLAQALALQGRVIPPHPDTAATLNSMGLVATAVGDYAEARGYHERALAIREEALGPDHPVVATTLNNLGLLASSTGNYAEALAYHRRALTIREKALGPDHADVASSLHNLGAAAYYQGRLADARGYSERALAIFEEALGPTHPHVAAALDILGTVARAEGRYEDARRQHERALTLREAVRADHPDVAFPLTGLGDALLSLGRPAEALPHLERALTIRSANKVNASLLATTRFYLARALWASPVDRGRDRPRALELGRLARPALAEAGQKSVRELTALDAWLRERGDDRR